MNAATESCFIANVEISMATVLCVGVEMLPSKAFTRALNLVNRHLICIQFTSFPSSE